MRAVVDDSGFSDAVSEIGNSFEHFIHLPAFPFARISVAIAELRAGVNVTGIRPIDVVKRIGPRPLFIIHCASDTVVPPSHSQALFAAAAEPKSMWLLQRGFHIAAATRAVRKELVVIAIGRVGGRVFQFANGRPPRK